MSTEQPKENETSGPSNVAKLIEYAKSGNAVEFRNTFNAELDSRIHTRIEARKQEVSSEFSKRISGQTE